MTEYRVFVTKHLDITGHPSTYGGPKRVVLSSRDLDDLDWGPGRPGDLDDLATWTTWSRQGSEDPILGA